VLKLAERWEIIKRCPDIHINAEGEHRRDYVITEDVLAKMLAHEKCTPLLRRLLPFLIDTGLRLSEALALRWINVDLKSKESSIQVTEGKTKAAIRRIPLTHRAHDILKQMRDEGLTKISLFVFPAADGGQSTRHWPSEQFRELKDAMGLPKDCVIHSCRHTFCTRLGEAGVDVFTLKTSAGHHSVKVSERYVHPAQHAQIAAIKKLNQTAKAAEK
jgi:integrase